MSESKLNPYRSPGHTGKQSEHVGYFKSILLLVLLPCLVMISALKFMIASTSTYGDHQIFRGKFYDLFDSYSGILYLLSFLLIDIVAPVIAGKYLFGRLNANDLSQNPAALALLSFGIFNMVTFIKFIVYIRYLIT